MNIPKDWDGESCPNPKCPSPKMGLTYKVRCTQEMTGGWGQLATLGDEVYEASPYTVGCIACKKRFDRIEAQGEGQPSL